MEIHQDPQWGSTKIHNWDLPGYTTRINQVRKRERISLKTRPSFGSEAATMFKCECETSFFEYANWPRLQMKRTGPYSWSVQLVLPAGPFSWSIQLVHPVGPSSWAVQLVCLAKCMCCKVQKLRFHAMEIIPYTFNFINCILCIASDILHQSP